ncbi:Hypothetical protein POVN_LOCUS575 [uncultured virus]|nr:Hypothetical protein POVN_LOCUS575 [uncultured virus]
MADVIQKGTSRYKSHLVNDKEIVRFVGIETYCRLRRGDPDLYNDLLECSKVPEQPTEIEALVMTASPRAIKEQLINYIVTGETTPLTDQLTLPDNRQLSYFQLEDAPGSTVIWIIVLFVMIAAIVWAFIVLGFTEAVFGPVEPIRCLSIWQ